MGEEIGHSRFRTADFIEFRARLQRETALLRQWFADDLFAADPCTGGLELEAWLIDGAGRPAPVNVPFLAALAHPLVVPELALFNIEINSTPVRLEGGALSVLHAELYRTWQACRTAAAGLGADALMAGILPSLEERDLNIANMSSLQRYRALNEQVFRLRHGEPIRLDIRGAEHLELRHDDVMLEAGATSLQLHLKVAAHESGRFYNAAKILSAPMVALAANSPYLFGRDLWDETRIPLFEQAVSVGASDYSKRVSFGVRYAERSVLECFEANSDRYPVLLPRLSDEPPEALPHLRLHNGTIWRWNRPLVGFEPDGRPHLRIEHRVAAAGPTPRDAVANAAFFFGLVIALARSPNPPEASLDFGTARANFYEAARHGLAANVTWLDGQRGSLAELLRGRLLPQAAEGLALLGTDRAEIAGWLGILRGRLDSGRNGAAWQRAWVGRHGHDMRALTLACRDRQGRDQPVHEWDV